MDENFERIKALETAVIQIGKDLVKTIDKVSSIEKRMKEIEKLLE